MEAPASGLSLLSSKTEERITLKAHHTFGNFTQRLHPLDRIWFKGTIKNSLLSNKMKNQVNSKMETSSKKQGMNSNANHLIEIDSVGCVSCDDKELEAISIKNDFKMKERIRDLNRGFKYLLNVLFNPLVTFK